MSKVTRTRTVTEVVEVDDGEGFHPTLAIGIALGRNAWDLVSDETNYEVEESGQVFNQKGRQTAGTKAARKAKGRG